MGERFWKSAILQIFMTLGVCPEVNVDFTIRKLLVSFSLRIELKGLALVLYHVISIIVFVSALSQFKIHEYGFVKILLSSV